MYIKGPAHSKSENLYFLALAQRNRMQPLRSLKKRFSFLPFPGPQNSSLCMSKNMKNHSLQKFGSPIDVQGVLEHAAVFA